MSNVDYDLLIPNNVGLSGDPKLRRALEEWHPGYIDWWMDMGPEGFQTADVWLRTAISVDKSGWAKFGYVKMPDYRWGVLLAQPEEGRVIPCGEHYGAGRRCRVNIGPCCGGSLLCRVIRNRLRLSNSGCSGRAHLPYMTCATSFR
jgi:hypothetical protein